MKTTYLKIVSLTYKYEKIIQAMFAAMVVIAASWSLSYPGFNFGHDLNLQVRVFEMAQGLQEGIFPVIWSQNLGFGLGMPLFEFYAPLPYYMGAIIYLLGFNLTVSTEMVMFMTNVLTFFGMYLLGKELFKHEWPALISAAAATLAPYRAVDLFVRTALSETWAIALLPFVFWGELLVVRSKRYGWLILSLSFASLILSHNLTALMAVPFIVFVGLVFLLTKTQSLHSFIRQSFKLMAAGILGLGLAAFYWYPALVEKDLTQVDKFTQDRFFDINQHFLYIRQFLKPWGEWEYGGSGWGPHDEMSFFLGYPHLIILVASSVLLCYHFIKQRVKALNNKLIVIALLGLIATGASLYLSLLKSQPLWNLFTFTQYFQFPWRMLSMQVIFSSLLAGVVYSLLKKTAYSRLFAVSVFILLFSNARYFQSEKYVDYSSEYQDYAHVIRSERSTNLYDYLPKDLNVYNKQGFYIHPDPQYQETQLPARSIIPEKVSQNNKVTIEKDHTTHKVFTITTQKPDTIPLNLAYYPGWTAIVNNQNTQLKPNQHGLATLHIPKGKNHIIIFLKDTPIRRFSKIISLLSLLILGGVLVHSRTKNSLIKDGTI